VLSGPFHLFGLEWPIASDTFVHVLWPDATTFSYGQRLLQGGASIAAGAAVAIAVGRRMETVWLAPMAVTVIRLLLDPLNLNHYWMPFLILVSVGAGLLRPPAAGLPLVIPVLVLGLVMIPRLRLTPAIPWSSGWLLLPFAIAFVVMLVPLIRRAVAEPGPTDQGAVKGSGHASLAHRG
jgi:hypothetical protein